MGYSRAHLTGNAADHFDDDVNLFRFSYKSARRFFDEGVGLEKIVRGVSFPAVFLGMCALAPLKYKVDNSFVYGTPEYEKRVSKIQVWSHPRGFGVIVKYPE